MESQARFSEFEILERVAVESQCKGLSISDVREAVETCLKQDEVVQLKDSRGVRTFTTKEMLRVERRMLDTAKRLSSESSHAVTLPAVQAVVKDSILNAEQREAVRHICIGGDLVSVCGIAGSGKSTMLRAAAEVLRGAGFNPLGTTLQAKASRGLEESSGIRSVHIHSLLSQLDKGSVKLDEKSVLVVDEAGMVGSRLMDRLVSLVNKAKAKIVLVGDHRQLQAVSAGAPFRAIGELGVFDLTTIVRQKEEWARRNVQLLRAGRADEALEELDRRGHLVITEERDEAVERLVADWKSIALGNELKMKETCGLAGTNLEVREVNRRIHEERLAAGELGEATVECDGMSFRICDRVVITRNNALLGKSVVNGAEGEVTGVDGDTIWIRFDDGYQIEADISQLSLAHAYCLTVHKAQGVTKDNSLLLLGSMTDREFSYVAGSRHRENVRVYADKLTAEGIPELAAMMSRSRQAENAHEYLMEVS